MLLTPRSRVPLPSTLPRLQTHMLSDMLLCQPSLPFRLPVIMTSQIPLQPDRCKSEEGSSDCVR